MQMCILRGVSSFRNKGEPYNIVSIINKYRNWPIPRGLGEGALGHLKKTVDQKMNVKEVYQQKADYFTASDKASGNQSNGALMRILPLSIYTHRLEDTKEIHNVIVLEQFLSHCDITVI